MTPEQAFVCACAAPGDDAALGGRLREAAGRVRDWRAVVDTAHVHWVTPLLRRGVTTIPDDVPRDVHQDVEKRWRTAWQRSLLLAGELRRLVAATGDGAIPFKGPTLASLAYGNVSLREANDLDLLVHPDDLPRVSEALTEAGYPCDADVPHVIEAARRHRGPLPQQIPFWNDRGPVLVEVHTSLLPRFFALDLEPWCRERLADVDVAGGHLRTFAPEPMLLYLCAHALKDGWVRLQHAADLAWLVARRPIDGREVVAHARDLGATRLLEVGLAVVRGLLGVDLPADLDVRTDPVAEDVARDVVSRFWDRPWLRPGVRQSWLHLRARERTRDKARYLAKIPGDLALGDFTAVRLPPALFPLYYAVRAGRLAVRYRAGVAPERPPSPPTSSTSSSTD